MILLRGFLFVVLVGQVGVVPAVGLVAATRLLRRLGLRLYAPFRRPISEHARNTLQFR